MEWKEKEEEKGGGEGGQITAPPHPILSLSLLRRKREEGGSNSILLITCSSTVLLLQREGGREGGGERMLLRLQTAFPSPSLLNCRCAGLTRRVRKTFFSYWVPNCSMLHHFPNQQRWCAKMEAQSEQILHVAYKFLLVWRRLACSVSAC